MLEENGELSPLWTSLTRFGLAISCLGTSTTTGGLRWPTYTGRKEIFVITWKRFREWPDLHWYLLLNIKENIALFLPQLVTIHEKGEERDNEASYCGFPTYFGRFET